MPRPATVRNPPRYVVVAEECMREYFDLDLWQLLPQDRTRILVAACDAETHGAPQDAECYVGAAVFDAWKDIKAERAASKKKWRADKGG